MSNGSGKPRKSISRNTKRMAAALLALIWIRHFKALTLTQAIEDSKALHARRWQTKEGMYRIKRQALPDVRDAPLHADNAAASCSEDGEAGMETMLWDISVIPNGTGQEIPYASSGSSTYECVGLLRTFHTFSPPVSPSKTLAVSLFVFVGVWVWVCLLLCRVFVSCFASVMESRIRRAY